MTTYVSCPNCRVKYPLEKLYVDAHDQPAPSKSYTVVCAVCSQQFDVSFRKRRFLPMRAVVK
ncbi:MAG: hypothetical protein O2909_11900 [Chloroflexi bacterium]|nr:hypothetical protein [Chloroflexota bacterium]MDA1220122.1 hypothetical protein [Chloroflexota bacterium]PKB58051.1 MAG: hypothetical protein BZY73_00185 [SAR202 cluster bacterium Casp-Chloro-G3]